MAFSSASMFRAPVNGSGMRGVTGLSTSDGKSSMLGDRISGGPGRPAGNPNPGPNGLSLKFFRLFRRSYSLEADFSFFVTPVLTGGIGFLDGGSGRVDFAGSEDPVSIWTTCLKEEASAWTKVVGYGLLGSDLVTGSTGGGGAGAAAPLLLLLMLELLLLRLSGEETGGGFRFSRGVIEASIDGSISRERNSAARIAGK